MSKFAKGTTVPEEKSRAELELLLKRYGAEAFVYGWEDGHQRVPIGNGVDRLEPAPRAVISFKLQGRYFRVDVPMPPKPKGEGWKDTRAGLRRQTEAQRLAQHTQLVRERWRAVLLVIKAKLEAVETGISTFEQEFLANLLLPDRSSVGEWAAEQIEQVYSTGKMPPLLPGARE